MPTTSKGRIVYARKPHLFRYRDILRIVRIVEPIDVWKAGLTELPEMFGSMLAIEADMLSVFGRLGIQLVPEQKTLEFLLKTVAWLIEMLKRSPVSILNEVSGVLWGGLVGEKPPGPAESEPQEEKGEEDASSEWEISGQILEQSVRDGD